ncbi:hypothetical protein [Phyllobacterium sp. SB3]|uniref:hypothetical protein n=1 Tax=Phyllobacterium sp. SB3 TaxID=3156073 RepID=UPI0032AF1E63
MRYNLAFMGDGGDGAILSGAVNGKIAFAQLVKEIDNEANAPIPLFLDFKHVDVATASYLRESIFALKNYMRAVGSKYYPVAANPNDSVHDELLMVANAKNDAILSCLMSDDNLISNVTVIGLLDVKQQRTFELVCDLRKTDANQLMEQFGESEEIKVTTAWNNRLAGLANKGLIREFTKGRSKYYRPVLEVSD